jgi:hypothetical protein
VGLAYLVGHAQRAHGDRREFIGVNIERYSGGLAVVGVIPSGWCLQRAAPGDVFLQRRREDEQLVLAPGVGVKASLHAPPEASVGEQRRG